MSMKIGLDVLNEKIFMEVGPDTGVLSAVSMNSRVARVCAAQLLVSADTLDTLNTLDAATEEGLPGNDDADGA